MMNLFLIFLGAGLGGVCRYLVSTWTHQHTSMAFPLATLCVNVVGSFFMGLLFVVLLTKESQIVLTLSRAFLMVGFLGGFTTFSSFSIETLTLWQAGDIEKAALNIMANVFLCLLAVLGGVWIGKWCLRIV